MPRHNFALHGKTGGADAKEIVVDTFLLHYNLTMSSETFI